MTHGPFVHFLLETDRGNDIIQGVFHDIENTNSLRAYSVCTLVAIGFASRDWPISTSLQSITGSKRFASEIGAKMNGTSLRHSTFLP